MMAFTDIICLSYAICLGDDKATNTSNAAGPSSLYIKTHLLLIITVEKTRNSVEGYLDFIVEKHLLPDQYQNSASLLPLSIM